MTLESFSAYLGISCQCHAELCQRQHEKKFVITDDLVVVCKELGWNIKEIEQCGSVNSYMKKHLKHGLSFVFD